MPINDNFYNDKLSLRKQLINSRKGIDPDRKAIMDFSIYNAVISLDQYKNTPTVLTYVSTNIEVDTIKLIDHALIYGKKIAAPVCDYNTSTIKFYQINSRDDLYPARFSLLEPIPNDDMLITSMLDSICIVPGLAFDKRGYRLGYGKGFYDRFLSEYDGHSIGICYDDFICDRLAIDEFDIPVNLVITDNATD